MADVLSKINLFSSHDHNVSVFPKSCVFNKSGASLKLNSSEISSLSFSSTSNFLGRRIVVLQEGKTLLPNGGSSRSNSFLVNAQTNLRIGKAQKWWEKGIKPNMREITSAQDLVDSLLNAGDKLVAVDFFSPGCGGCKALHPKICQLAEMNPDVQFLQVNYEEHKSMSYSLNVHVLPFFRFYRGAHGRLCSFSCTNATIKKFKDALAKHTPDRCSIRPTKGLEEKELLALSANKDLSFSYNPKPVEPVPNFANQVVAEKAETSFSKKEAVPASSLNLAQSSEKKTLVTVG